MAGRKDQAIEMAENYMKDSKEVKDYNMLVLMGEMKGEHTFFEKADEISGGKCSKALRMLGRYWFYQNDFKKSTEYYDRALKINKLYPDVWFAKGCAHMRMEDFKNAIFSLSQVISIDMRHVEAWANIASCYIVTKKFFEAVTCCEQALKCNRKAWKIWANYIIFSIDTL